MDENDRRAVRHLKKFEDVSKGLTPAEFHWKHTYPNGRCTACKGRLGPGSLVARSFMPIDELRKRNPILLGQMYAAMRQRGLGVQAFVVTASDGIQYLRASTAFACASHAQQLEKAAAKGPSWVFVDFDRGPAASPKVFGPVGLNTPTFPPSHE